MSELQSAHLVYIADMTQANAAVVPIAHVVEVSRPEKSLFALAHRHQLPVDIRASIDLRTWPEIIDLKAFMNDIFIRVVETPPGERITALERRYSIHSALQLWRFRQPVAPVYSPIPDMLAKTAYFGCQALIADIKPAPVRYEEAAVNLNRLLVKLNN